MESKVFLTVGRFPRGADGQAAGTYELNLWVVKPTNHRHNPGGLRPNSPDSARAPEKRSPNA